ncbi:MAG TPA: prepilin-type N-terminal cleavage/methylation domain-containing protein [Planctomycetota bacterium]|nr:prepilin-type N-terminal cleavage/methylation domain-containing protein [Planctomycetota bacterium]
MRHLISRARHGSGFTMIEMLIVIGIILILMGLILPALASARTRRLIVLAQSEVKQIKAACDAYYDALHEYPPDTDVFSTGSTPELVNDPYAINNYLGREITDQKTGKKYGPFLQLKLTYLKGPANAKVYMDPWNKPYKLDAIHSRVDPATGQVQIYGEPYPAGTESAKQVVEVKVWSGGPDGEETDGSNSEQGKNGSSTGGPPENDDNLCSWESS